MTTTRQVPNSAQATQKNERKSPPKYSSYAKGIGKAVVRELIRWLLDMFTGIEIPRDFNLQT